MIFTCSCCAGAGSASASLYSPLAASGSCVAHNPHPSQTPHMYANPAPHSQPGCRKDQRSHVCCWRGKHGLRFRLVVCCVACSVSMSSNPQKVHLASADGEERIIGQCRCHSLHGALPPTRCVFLGGSTGDGRVVGLGSIFGCPRTVYISECVPSPTVWAGTVRQLDDIGIDGISGKRLPQGDGIWSRNERPSEVIHNCLLAMEIPRHSKRPSRVPIAALPLKPLSVLASFHKTRSAHVI